MNLSKNNSDLSRSPLKIGGSTPESARLPPLLGGSTGGGAGALIVAPMYSKPVTLLRALKAGCWRKGVRLLGKSTGAMASRRSQGFTSPKVDVQAWPLSNTTVQEELL